MKMYDKRAVLSIFGASKGMPEQPVCVLDEGEFLRRLDMSCLTTYSEHSVLDLGRLPADLIRRIAVQQLSFALSLLQSSVNLSIKQCRMNNIGSEKVSVRTKILLVDSKDGRTNQGSLGQTRQGSRTGSEHHTMQTLSSFVNFVDGNSEAFTDQNISATIVRIVRKRTGNDVSLDGPGATGNSSGSKAPFCSKEDNPALNPGTLTIAHSDVKAQSETSLIPVGLVKNRKCLMKETPAVSHPSLVQDRNMSGKIVRIVQKRIKKHVSPVGAGAIQYPSDLKAPLCSKQDNPGLNPGTLICIAHNDEKATSEVAPFPVGLVENQIRSLKETLPVSDGSLLEHLGIAAATGPTAEQRHVNTSSDINCFAVGFSEEHKHTPEHPYPDHHNVIDKQSDCHIPTTCQNVYSSGSSIAETMETLLNPVPDFAVKSEPESPVPLELIVNTTNMKKEVLFLQSDTSVPESETKFHPKTSNIFSTPQQYILPMCCPRCNQSFESYDKLGVHVADVHMQNTPNCGCRDCGERIVTLSDFISHEAQHYRNRQLMCEFCSWQFYTESELEAHTQTHRSGAV